jgi:hypothetical protein
MNKSKELDRLVQCLETALAKLPQDLDAETAALKERADDTIFEAWTAISGQNVCSPLVDATAYRLQKKIYRQPWRTFGIAFLLGGIAGYFAGKSPKSGTIVRD